MKNSHFLRSCFFAAFWLAPTLLWAQPPGPGLGGPPSGGPLPQGRPLSGPPGAQSGRPDAPGPLMLALDIDGDGVLSAEEIRKAPESLLALDTNKNGQIERSELRARAVGRGAPAGPAGAPPSAPGAPGPGGPPGVGGRGFGGPPGVAGPGAQGEPGAGLAGPRRPGRALAIGDVLPPFARSELRLDEDQRKKIESLESETRGKLEAILTPEQKKDLERLLQRGPVGLPPGGPGPGGPLEDDGPPVRPARPDAP